VIARPEDTRSTLRSRLEDFHFDALIVLGMPVFVGWHLDLLKVGLNLVGFLLFLGTSRLASRRRSVERRHSVPPGCWRSRFAGAVAHFSLHQRLGMAAFRSGVARKLSVVCILAAGEIAD